MGYLLATNRTSEEGIRQIICAAKWSPYWSNNKSAPVSTLEIYQFPLYFTALSRKTTFASPITHESYLRHEADKNVWRRPRDEIQTSLLTPLSDIGDTAPSFPKLRESCAIKRFLWRVYGIEERRENYRHRQLLGSIILNILRRINYKNFAIKVIFPRNIADLTITRELRWSIKIVRFLDFY